MYNTKGTLRVDGKDTYFLIHETQEEDDDRTRIYNSTEMDGAIQYGKPGKRTPLWLSSIMKKEMRYLNDILHGMEPTEEFVKLLTGEAPVPPSPQPMHVPVLVTKTAKLI